MRGVRLCLDSGVCAFTLWGEGRLRNGREIDRARDSYEPFYFLSFMARSTSRPASRVLIVARRSCCFFPFANPSSTLA